ncbi:MAG TPA: ABC transporter permease [Parachlamydiaceae bacterium]|nr:ABC transporter permease [Parachlamydiaceae bacterium]
MLKIMVNKFGYVCLSLLIVTTMTFILMKAIPGDPFQQEQALPTEIHQALLTHYGLNEPIAVQYYKYILQLAHFDFGPSLVYKGQSVSHIIRQSFPTSALLGATALAFAVPCGLIMGMIAGAKQNRWQDATVAIAAVVGISVPGFIIATLLQYILAIKLEVFPIARWGTFSHVILPALSLAALPMAFIARMTRTKMIEEMKQGYIATARAKGLSEARIIFTHAFRNLLVPILSYLGPLTASILTGSFIVEKIYGIPGLGYWFVISVSNRDYPLIMGVTVFYCAFLLIATFLVDMYSLYLDPRLRLSSD